jgi:serine phosphatase RsbU (regulator of sigma subunit)/transcriptional regulator with GAF, ATPase, and Fis domain
MIAPFHPLTLLAGALPLATLGFVAWRDSRRQIPSAEQITELEVLARIGRALVESELDPDALSELIYEQAGAIIDTSFFQLGLFEDDDYRVVIRFRDGERQPPTVYQDARGQGLVGWVWNQREPLLIGDFQAEWEDLPAQPRYLDEHPPRSAVFIPLITGDHVIGMLVAQSRTPQAYSEDDVRRLTIVANQAAAAIESARLYQSAQTRAAQLELVGRVSRQVRALTPLKDLFEQTVRLIHETFGYYSVNIFICDTDTGQVKLQASTDAEMMAQYPELPPDKGLVNWAVDHMQTVLANDVSADPRYLEASVLPQTCSEAVAPLMIENRVLGALDVQSDRPGAFGPEDVRALEALADQIALAIQESRLYHAERHQRSVAETLREVAQTLTSTLELETVLNAILSDLRRVLAYDAAAILLLESDNTVVIRAAQGTPSASSRQGQRFFLDESDRLVRLAEGDQPIIFDHHGEPGGYHSLLGLPAEHACLGAPLIARGELIGFLTADAFPPHRYQREDAAVLAIFAGQAAVAIDNARLFAAQREEAWVSSALLQLAEATARYAELDQVIDTIVHMTVSLVEVGQCGVLLWQEERGRFQGSALAGSRGELSDEFALLECVGDGWAPLAALKEDPKPILLGGAEALSGLPNELFDFFGLDSWLLLLPLMSKGQLLGVMLVSGESEHVDLIRRRVHLISGIANQAAMAIENAQLYVAQQEEAYVTIALLQVAEVVNSLTELEDILGTIARLAPILAGVEQCVILLGHGGDDHYEIGPAYGLGDDDRLRLATSLSSTTLLSFLGDLQVGGGAIGAGANYPLALPAAWQEIFGAAGSLLALPLVTRRELVGAMLVTFPVEEAPLSGRRQNILTGIAHQASTAIETDQLYAEAVERERMERELEVAREIQSSFLPEVLPVESGWSVGSFWRAARQVGGDFFDFFRFVSDQPGRQWGIVIADVADKGVPAALYMALSRTLIRTVGLSRIDPATTLARVNDLLLSDSRSDLFVTVIYVVWDPDERRLVYANGGHNPPLCIRADGRVEILTDNDIVLGVLPSVPMANRRVDLKPGDLIVLYTDGIPDAINAREEEFGLDRLIHVANANRHHSAPEVVDAIRRAVTRFVGGTPQFDDLTLVVLKCEGAQASRG